MQVTVTICHTEPAGTGTVSINCNSQLVLFTTEWQCELQPAMAFLKICLQQGSVGGGEEVTLNLHNKFIRKYECLLFCSIYLQSSLPSKFQVAVNSISAQNRTRVYELFTTQTKEVISCSYVYKSWITLYMCMGSTRKWLWHVSLPTPRTSVLVHVVLLLKKSVSKATNASTNRQVAESEAEFIGLSCKELLFPLYSPESTLYWLNFHTKKNLEI